MSFQVQENGNGSIRENGLVMASVTKMAAAARLAEERIRLDIGDDISVEDEVTDNTVGITENELEQFKLANPRKNAQSNSFGFSQLKVPFGVVDARSFNLCETLFRGTPNCFCHRMWGPATRRRVHRQIPYSIAGQVDERQVEIQRPLHGTPHCRRSPSECRISPRSVLSVVL